MNAPRIVIWEDVRVRPRIVRLPRQDAWACYCPRGTPVIATGAGHNPRAAYDDWVRDFARRYFPHSKLQ